jgi:hypothetical protein
VTNKRRRHLAEALVFSADRSIDRSADTRRPWDRRNCRRLVTLLSICSALITGACSSPAREFSRYAQTLGMREDVVDGTAFQHVVFTRIGRSSRTLHVYLDGDGMPWRPWGPSADPTPRNPLVLRLMALDPVSTLYLGRPCYHGSSRTPPCANPLWTGDRYSEAVVSSMTAALRRMLSGTEFDRLVWFGYSGGGTLAMLLAPRFGATTDVITIAANLDIDAWTDLHGYSRLAGSSNPARQPPLPARIRQRHYVGGKDTVVPRHVVARGLIDRGPLIVIPDYDHTCCWETMWAGLVDEIDRGQPSGR